MLYTSPLPTLRRHKTSASLLAFIGGRLHTRHTAHESYAYRLLRQKKKNFNSEEARARDEGDGIVQIRDPEPTTALSFGQGQRSSMHCTRAVSDQQRFSPPKPLSTFRAISMMTSIEQSSMNSQPNPLATARFDRPANAGMQRVMLGSARHASCAHLRGRRARRNCHSLTQRPHVQRTLVTLHPDCAYMP